MFTGIVETRGRVVRRTPLESGAEFWIEADFAGEVETGESVAVNGACLTATTIEPGRLRFDLLDETLQLTNLGDLKQGADVNLERALRAGDRLSGHFVQGHVDACVEVVAYEPSGQDHRLEIVLPGEFLHLAVPKGSICIDGISLTVAEVGESSLTIWIIPHTHEVTRLESLRAGDRVNVEFDLVAKHIARLVERGRV